MYKSYHKCQFISFSIKFGRSLALKLHIKFSIMTCTIMNFSWVCEINTADFVKSYLWKQRCLISRKIKRIQTASGGESGFCFISRQILHFKFFTVGMEYLLHLEQTFLQELPILCLAPF